MLFAPLQVWRHVMVTERRTAKDFALVIQDLVDKQFPDAEKIVLVLDNLNTHTAASLYEAFPPDEAKRLADKKAGTNLLNGRQIQGGIGAIARENLCHQRHRHRIQRGHHDFDLEDIGSVIFAVSKL